MIMIFTVFLSLWVQANPEEKMGHTNNRRWELNPLASIIELKDSNPSLLNETTNQAKELKKVKFYILNGEIRLAKMYLTKLSYTQSKLTPVILRYLGILFFIEGNYEKSYYYLDRPELKNFGHFAKICSIKVLTDIILDKNLKLQEDWSRCRLENTNNIQESNLVWLETLVDLKLNPRQGATSIPFRETGLRMLSNSDLKIILKLALYINQEKMIERQLTDLTEDHIRDPEIREIVGHIYFRLGSPKKSYRFIEDLKSPNSETMKGNLYIWRKKYELAYAQFKLAIEQKDNSQNAIERLLPLAWLLGDWKGGQEYAERVIASSDYQVNKLTLVAAFLTQKGDFERASKALDSITQMSRRGAEIDVTQLYSFVNLMLNKPDRVQKYAFQSCEQYDLMNCWLQLQMTQWDAFPLTMRRDEKIPYKKEWEKLVESDELKPLKETAFVNQLDVEEMDDKLIQIIPITTP